MASASSSTEIAAPVRKQLTLLLLHHDGKILLGLKKRGFGQGKYNGFGGKIDPKESVSEATVREMKEESGLDVNSSELVYIGHLVFHMTGSNNPEILEVHVMKATSYTGEIVESEEMAPEWFLDTAIPFEKMWLDDKYWFSYMIEGVAFEGDFVFRGHEEIVSYTVRANGYVKQTFQKEVGGGGSGGGGGGVKEVVVHPAGIQNAVLVTEVQGAIMS